MTLILDFARTWIGIHVVLVVSYLVFRGVRFGAEKLRLPVSSLQLLRAGQLMLAFALLVPLAPISTSRSTIPKAIFLPIDPVSEWIDSSSFHFTQTTSGESKAESKTHGPVPSASVLEKLNSFVRSLAPSLALKLLFIIASLLSSWVSMIALARGGMRLKELLQHSLPFRKLGRVSVVVSESTQVPFSTLLFGRAWTVLPEHLVQTRKDFRIALQHEFQHHRSRDTAWALAMDLILCIFAVNPAIRLWKKALTELQEFSCDEALVGRARVSFHDYGSCLLRVAEAALGNRQMHVGTTFMAATSKDPIYVKSFLRRRIEMLINSPNPRRSRRAGILLGTLMSAIVIVLGFASQRQSSAEEAGRNPGVLQVDPEIQKIAQDEVRKAVIARKAKFGYAVVADPATGRVLAAAGFDRSGTKSPTSHWPLSEAVEPASVFKGIVAAKALNLGKTTPEEKHNCEKDNYRYGDRVYHDWKAFGSLTTAETIAMSSNICGIKIGEKVGAQELEKTFSEFGFGAGGVTEGVPEAIAGGPPKLDETTAAQYVPFVSTGYGFYVTPLEIVQAYGAIANGGKLLKPVAASSKGGELIRQVLSPDTSRQMRQILAGVVSYGTAKNKAVSPHYSLAGKTSTSYHPNEPEHRLLGGFTNNAGFVGFSPVENPRIVIYVNVDTPTLERLPHGSTDAAPVVAAIAERSLQYMGVPSDTGRERN